MEEKHINQAINEAEATLSIEGIDITPSEREIIKIALEKNSGEKSLIKSIYDIQQMTKTDIAEEKKYEK